MISTYLTLTVELMAVTQLVQKWYAWTTGLSGDRLVTRETNSMCITTNQPNTTSNPEPDANLNPNPSTINSTQ